MKTSKNNLIKLNEKEVESISGGLTEEEIEEFYPNSNKHDSFRRWEESAGTCKKCGKRYTYCNQGIESPSTIFSRRDYCGECRSELRKKFGIGN